MKSTGKFFVKKGCHSRMSLSGIYNACSYTREQQTTCVEDPRLQVSGMTTYLDAGQALPDNRKYLVEDDSCVVGPEQKLLRTSALFNCQVEPDLHIPLIRTSSTFPLQVGRQPSPLEGEGARRAGEGGASGFTLIELLVVVLILGILTAVALPQYQKAVWKFRLTKPLSMMAEIQQNMDLYLLENGFPEEGEFVYFLAENNPYSSITGKAIGLSCIEKAYSNHSSVYNNFCYDDNFVYLAECDSYSCWIAVGDDPEYCVKQGRWDWSFFSISMERRNNQQTWTKECWYMGNSIGEYACEKVSPSWGYMALMN